MYDLCYRPQTKTLIEVESIQMYACSHHGLPSCICYGTFLIAHYIPLPMAFIASNTIIYVCGVLTRIVLNSYITGKSLHVMTYI